MSKEQAEKKLCNENNARVWNSTIQLNQIKGQQIFLMPAIGGHGYQIVFFYIINAL